MEDQNKPQTAERTTGAPHHAGEGRGPRRGNRGGRSFRGPRGGMGGGLGGRMKRMMRSKGPRRFGGSRGGMSGSSRAHGGAGTPAIEIGEERSENRAPLAPIPPIAPGNIRIIPLGGVEEIGKNMTAIEIGEDIIVIDAGFQFKEEATPGIDYILPNTKYLEERKDRIRALFITHGHLDHIGGIPYVVDRIGYPPLYTRQFGAIMIQKRQEEFPHLEPLDIKVISGNETITCGKIKVKTFPISHTIPDSMGLIIDTPYGDIVFIEDVRVDNIKGVPTEEEIEQYRQFKDRNVLLLTMDSTSIEKPGFSLSESVVIENIDKFIQTTSGRLIIGTFASQVERIIAIIKAAEKYNKKVVVEGRSMKTNVDIIKHLKLAEIKNIIPVEDIEKYPPDRIVMLVTGAQGEEFAALMRMATKQHKHVQLRKTDTILLSSSIIPTNYNAVIKLKDNLYRTEARVITYLDSDIHASGHGNRDELKWIHEQIKYRFFVPLHGYHYFLRQHAELSMSLGTPRENVVVPDNGSVIEIYEEGRKIRVLKEKAPANLVLVDGFAVGDAQEVVLRDRQSLAQDGMFIVFAVIDAQTGRLRKSPDIISRGFVYLRESQDLLRDTRDIIKNTIEDTARGMNPLNVEMIKANVTDTVSRHLFQETAKRPVVIPVLLTI
ncbi:MAG TPA: ribonuclease J [Candidatus Paceibacterota bacterium]|nr:ribonuclease J [Candidatus Paceibacterota bacterium]